MQFAVSLALRFRHETTVTRFSDVPLQTATWVSEHDRDKHRSSSSLYESAWVETSNYFIIMYIFL